MRRRPASGVDHAATRQPMPDSRGRVRPRRDRRLRPRHVGALLPHAAVDSRSRAPTQTRARRMARPRHRADRARASGDARAPCAMSGPSFTGRDSLSGADGGNRGLSERPRGFSVRSRRAWPRVRRPLYGACAVGPWCQRDCARLPPGKADTMTNAISTVPVAERWSYGPFEFQLDTGLRTVPLVRDDGRAASFTIPEFVSEPRDLQEIACIVIAACERWEDRQGVGG